MFWRRNRLDVCGAHAECVCGLLVVLLALVGLCSGATDPHVAMRGVESIVDATDSDAQSSALRHGRRALQALQVATTSQIGSNTAPLLAQRTIALQLAQPGDAVGGAMDDRFLASASGTRDWGEGSDWIDPARDVTTIQALRDLPQRFGSTVPLAAAQSAPPDDVENALRVPGLLIAVNNGITGPSGIAPYVPSGGNADFLQFVGFEPGVGVVFKSAGSGSLGGGLEGLGGGLAGSLEGGAYQVQALLGLDGAYVLARGVGRGDGEVVGDAWSDDAGADLVGQMLGQGAGVVSLLPGGEVQVWGVGSGATLSATPATDGGWEVVRDAGQGRAAVNVRSLFFDVLRSVLESFE
ncbi:unnamed protein product [Pedinophyceae sp. YPF-701]|nr:unnamed protein product [Pedinophyceae sp. YPF-701]